MLLETCLTVLTVAEKGTKLYDWFTGISTGDQRKKALSVLEDQKVPVERLSDRLMYVSGVQEAVNRDRSAFARSAREVRALLNPVAESLDADILTTTVAATPQRLREQFARNPWELLMEVRPAEHAKPPISPDMVPILFTEEGRPYVGWQTRGALPLMFDCEFRAGPDLWLPRELEKKEPTITEPETTVIADRRAPIFPNIEIAVVSALNKHAHMRDLHVDPDIPHTKLENARAECGMPQDETVLALIDTTLRKSGKNGMLFSNRGIYIRNLNESPIRISYEELCTRPIETRFLSGVLLGNSQEFDPSGIPKWEVISLLRLIQAYVPLAMKKK